MRPIFFKLSILPVKTAFLNQKFQSEAQGVLTSANVLQLLKNLDFSNSVVISAYPLCFRYILAMVVGSQNKNWPNWNMIIEGAVKLSSSTIMLELTSLYRKTRQFYFQFLIFFNSKNQILYNFKSLFYNLELYNNLFFSNAF